MTRPPVLALVAALALLAGCSTPPDYFHTLRPTVSPAPAGAREASRVLPVGPVTVPDSLGRDEWVVRTGHTGERIYDHQTWTQVSRVLAVGPVTVPDSLARDEWVVRTGDTGARIYDHQMWTQGLGADVAQSLVDYLNRDPLPDALWADAGPTGSGSGADLDHPAPLRVRVQVLRFDTVLTPAPSVSDQVRWTIECLPSDAALGPVEAGRYRLVRTAVRDAAGPAPAADAGVEASQQPFDRAARAHSETVRLVADDIANALRATAAERAQSCIAVGR